MQNNGKKHLSQLQCVQVSNISDCADHFDDLSPSHSHALSSSSVPSKSTAKEHATDTPMLSVPLESASKQVNVPLNCLEGIWAKASQLMNNNNAIVLAPGQDPEACMVLSYSGKVPHMVTPKKGGEFCCDSSCPNWKAMGICSHTVAVAEVNNKLPQFLSTKKRKKGVNVTKLLTTSMPKGRGQNGCGTPRARKPSQPATARVEMSVPDTDLETPAPSTATCHAHEGGSSFMPGLGSPHFSMVQSPVHFYSPYPTYPMYPPFHQGVPHEAGNPFQTSPPYQPYHHQPSLPFTLCFISGNISVCIECKNKYPKTPKPPQDLCIKHEEWRQFTLPNTATPQSKFGNIYYHCRMECVWMRCPNFTLSDLQVPPEMTEKLSSAHKELLLSTFGLVT